MLQQLLAEVLSLSKRNWKLQPLSYTEVKHSSLPSPPRKEQNKPVVYRSKHEPFMKLPQRAYILKHNQRSASGSGIPATAAQLLSMLLSRRAQAGWKRLPKEEGARLASSPLRQQKAVKRERILEKEIAASPYTPACADRPAGAPVARTHALPSTRFPIVLSPRPPSQAAGISHLKVHPFQGHTLVRFETHLARPKLFK